MYGKPCLNDKEEEMETETVKIRTLKGRIITLTISTRTDTHLSGTDKYGAETIIPIDEIDSMLPEGENNEK